MKLCRTLQISGLEQGPEPCRNQGFLLEARMISIMEGRVFMSGKKKCCSRHMLKGTYVANNKFYVFSSKNGKMNGTLSVKLRAACKQGKSTAALKRLLKNIGLKPLKVLKAEGYYGPGYDMLYTYKNFQISAYEDTDGSETFLGLIAR